VCALVGIHSETLICSCVQVTRFQLAKRVERQLEVDALRFIGAMGLNPDESDAQIGFYKTLGSLGFRKQPFESLLKGIVVVALPKHN
jgi:hypothetical protein